jgi:PIN domain nuclease of toxin-antitoxin system
MISRKFHSILDASALLAFLQNEIGTDVVEGLLEQGAGCSAVNWAEVKQKVIQHNGDWLVAAALLGSYELEILDATVNVAEAAASLWKSNSTLSLGDRFCLATAAEFNIPAWTADKAWGISGTTKQIR